MIRRILGFALYYGLGVGSAVLAMMIALPIQRPGGCLRAELPQGTVHALAVEVSSSCPAIAAEAPRCPHLVAVAAGSRCPYLAAVRAGGGCPYLAALARGSAGCPFGRGAGVGSACPYLQGRPSPGGADRTPDAPSPKATRPDSGWMPDGTVLARLEPLDPAPASADQG